MTRAIVVGLALVLASCGGSDARQMLGRGGDRALPGTAVGAEPDSPSTSDSSEAPVLAVGDSAMVGDWMLRVASVDVDGTDEVLAYNQFNEPPPDGMQYVLAGLEATYLGETSAPLWIDLGFTVTGPDGTRFEPWEPSCGVVPDDIDFAGEAFPGGTVTGATCWTVDSDVAADLVMEVVASGGGLQRPTRFSLDPEAEPVSGSTSPTDLPRFGLDPVAVGDPVVLGGWQVTVVGVDDDAAEVVLAENQFNDHPVDGYRYVLVELSAQRTAETAGSFTAEIGAKAVGAARRVAYEGFVRSCGVIPDPISDRVETPPGSVATGTLCWQVAEEDLSSLVMILAEFTTGDRAQLAVSRR
ncbi:MAG: hypothetical protein ACFCVC_17215 [Acidimicrobiia bacterium]